MILLPVVDRDLRIAARRRSTYWIRLTVALLALAITAWICYWSQRTQGPASVGKALFTGLAALAIGYGLLTGPFVTGDCLSEEKREGTLGLLFLTDLHSYDVVLGKWAARSLAAFYGIIALLPCLGVPLLLGGVAPGEYWRMAMATINATLFSLTAAMFVSAVSRDQSKTVIGSAVLVLAVAGLIPGLAVLFFTVLAGKPGGALPSIVLISPAYAGYLATDVPYRAGARQFWTALTIGLSMSLAFMLATMALLPKIWREDPTEAPRHRPWLWRLGYTPGWVKALGRWRERNPVFAAAARHRWPHLVMWSLVLIVTCNVYWLTYGYRKGSAGYQFHFYFSEAMYFINRIWIATMACRFFLEARRTGAIELLLTAPLQVQTILRGRRRALIRLFWLPVLVIGGLHAWYVYGHQTAYQGRNLVAPAMQYHYLVALGSFASFVADVMALSAVGAWMSLSSKRANLAVLKTFAYVILIPWTISRFMPNPISFLPGSMMAYYLGRPVLWVLKDVLFFSWAAYKIRRHFRAAAAQTYGLERPRRRRSWPFAKAAGPSPPTPVASGA